MPGTSGVGSLSRLKRRMKRPGELKTIEKALAALAAERGMSAGELEEIGLPDYGFAGDGTMDVAIGPAVAVLAITDANTLETSWRAADGRSLSGPPAAVKDGHADALKALKVQVKEIGETLAAQRLRLERLYLGDREWPLDIWRERYLDEPLVGNLARRLIWAFRIGEQWLPGLLQDGVPCDASVAPLAVDGGETRVRLWHPMQSDVAQVLAWRQRRAKLGIMQPFKQAHREIYVLTDAERETRLHSNRFAAHIVDQYRFRGSRRCAAAQAARRARPAGRVLGGAGRGVDGRGKLPLPASRDRPGPLRHHGGRASSTRANRSRALLRTDAGRRSVRRRR